MAKSFIDVVQESPRTGLGISVKTLKIDLKVMMVKVTYILTFHRLF